MTKVFAALVLLSASGSYAFAQQASTQQSPQVTTAQFLADPPVLLRSFLAGGPEMELVVQQLAVSDASTPPLLIGLLSGANPAQKSAIAQGLAQAAKIIVLTDQPRALDIQQRIAALNDPAVNTAFADGLGDVKLGAVGGGPLGGPGAGLGGQTNQLTTNLTNNGPAQPIGRVGTNIPTYSFPFTSSVTGLGSPSSSQSVVTTTAITSSVSSTTLP
jgi:hypothetical protein